MLTDIQKDVLNGALLGDGALIVHKRGSRPYFQYASKSLEHVNFIFNYLKNLCNYDTIKLATHFDTRTNKEYSHYYFRTKCLPELIPLHQQWYQSSTKKHRVPPDLRLSPMTLLVWYIGDGSNNITSRSQTLKLSTDSFDLNDIDLILLPLLKEFGAIRYKSDTHKEQYHIRIPHKLVDRFLSYIGPCPVDDYKYKWETVPYLRAKFKNGIDDLSDKKDEIVTLYLDGNSFYSIAKTLSQEPARIRYILKKSGVYVPKRDILRPALTEDEITSIITLRKDGVLWTDIEQWYNIPYRRILYYINQYEKR